jgi:hypothetical protein
MTMRCQNCHREADRLCHWIEGNLLICTSCAVMILNLTALSKQVAQLSKEVAALRAH